MTATIIEHEVTIDVDLNSTPACQTVDQQDNQCGKPATHRVIFTCGCSWIICDEHTDSWRRYIASDRYANVHVCGTCYSMLGIGVAAMFIRVVPL